MKTAQAVVTVCNQRGLHARASARFCEAAGAFEADVTVTKDTMTVGGTSLMALLILGAAKGTELIIAAEGVDADEAVDVLAALVTGGFGEDC